MNETTLRNVIRQEIKKQNSLLVEQGGVIYYDSGEFYDAFIGPWIDVLKIVKNESQKTVANVKTAFQVFFTLNDKKAKELIAKNRDRVKAINQETEQLLSKMPINKDFAAAAFIMNPAAFLAINHGPDFAKGSVDYLKGAGFGDFLPEEGAYEAEKRKQDDKGPIGKALQALEQIFLLAGAVHAGDLLSEQNEGEETEIEDAVIPPDLLLTALEETGDLKKMESLKSKMLQSFFEGEDGIDGIAILANNQIKFLNDVAASTNVEELNSGLQKLKQAAPEADLGDIAKLPETLKQDAENIASNKKAMEEITGQFREEKGLKDEEEINQAELKAYIDNVAFGQAMASVQSGAKSNIQNISQWAEKTIDDSVKDLINGMEEAVPGLEIDEKDSELQDLIRNAKSQISA